ncbi:MAG: hypothetical protein J6F31_02790 [Oscillospiraceae bacterium]|nr:hypothetical protein [Oscillospiraceae bacterium]
MKITKEKLTDMLARIAFADFTGYAAVVGDEKGERFIITPSDKLTRSQRMAIASMKMGAKGIELKLYDRIRAIELLARLTGVFNSEGSDLEALRSIFSAEDSGDDNS